MGSVHLVSSQSSGSPFCCVSKLAEGPTYTHTHVASLISSMLLLLFVRRGKNCRRAPQLDDAPSPARTNREKKACSIACNATAHTHCFSLLCIYYISFTHRCLFVSHELKPETWCGVVCCFAHFHCYQMNFWVFLAAFEKQKITFL